MGIRREKNWKAVNAQLHTIVREGVAAGGLTMERTIKKMLNRPGRGRIYLRRQEGAKFVLDGLTIGKVSFVTKGGVGVGEISAATAAAERYAELFRRRQARAAGKIAKPHTRRDQGFHRASAPLQPPALDTGRLHQSIGIDGSRLKQPQPTVRVGTKTSDKVPYAGWLEHGTRKMAPRPFMVPSVKKARPEILARFRTMLARLGRVR